MKRKIAFLVSSILMIFYVEQGASVDTIDHLNFDQILKEYVDDRGLIDYNGIAKEPRFHEYMQYNWALNAKEPLKQSEK